MPVKDIKPIEITHQRLPRWYLSFERDPSAKSDRSGGFRYSSSGAAIAFCL
jgi:hypothetical protein